MIFNRPQLKQCLQDRAALARLLSSPHEDAKALSLFRDRSEITQGFTTHWAKLARALENGNDGLPSLPRVGHIFIEIAVRMDNTALDRLLNYVGVDVEKEWEIPGHEHPWSAWLWLASLVLPDDTIKESLVENAWTSLLPQLIAAGFDLNKPSNIQTSIKLTRFDWLEMQDPVRLREAIASGERLALSRASTMLSCNNASRRL